MTSTPRVLVIMPCYNASSTLAHALMCIRLQSYHNFRLVCCDDASTDDTYQQLVKARQSFDFDLISNAKNVGTGMTVNRAIEYAIKADASYNFICWVSADNLLLPTFLSQHVNNLKSCAISYSAWDSFCGKVVNKTVIPERNLSKLKDGYRLGPSCMFRRWLFEKAGPFHALPGEDYHFAVRAAELHAKFGFIDTPLMRYRISDDSVSGRISSKAIKHICTHDVLHRARKVEHSNGWKIKGNEKRPNTKRRQRLAC